MAKKEAKLTNNLGGGGGGRGSTNCKEITKRNMSSKCGKTNAVMRTRARRYT